MRLPILAALLTAAVLPAEIGAQAVSDEKLTVNQLIVYGEDPCPPSTNEEITVCARKPEDERFRIPETLRGDPDDPKNETWTEKAEALEYVGLSGIGSCSPIGSGGASGCFQQLVRQAKAEQATGDTVNWTRLVEEAREERLSRIDAASERAEEALKQDEQ